MSESETSQRPDVVGIEVPVSKLIRQVSLGEDHGVLVRLPPEAIEKQDSEDWQSALVFVSPFEEDANSFASESDADDHDALNNAGYSPHKLSTGIQAVAIVPDPQESLTEAVQIKDEVHDGRTVLTLQVNDLDACDLVIGAKLGAGSYGSVHRGHQSSRGDVAVKLIHSKDASDLSSLHKEALAAMKIGHHPNIAQTYQTRVYRRRHSSVLEGNSRESSLSLSQDGLPATSPRSSAPQIQSPSDSQSIESNDNDNVVVFDMEGSSSRDLASFFSSLDMNRGVGAAERTEDLCFVLTAEFCNGGTLYEALLRGDLRNKDTQTKFKYIKDIILNAAYGVQYMHENDIIHRDLSNNNIMLHYTRLQDDGKPDAESLTVKLIDFGRAAVDAATAKKTDGVGTVSYSAPELMMEGHSSKASDIFSLGVLMWEVWTGSIAWENARIVQVIYAVTSGKTPPLPDDAPDELVDLMRQCWSFDPAQRPSIQTVVDHLENLSSSG